MSTRCTVTATISDPSAALQGNAFVRFRLKRFSGFVPRVLGSLVLAETQLDVFPNGSGEISAAIWGNDNIDPTGTFYTVEWWNQGRITSSGNFLITGATFDLDTAPIINPPALPPNVTLQGILAPDSVQSISTNTSVGFAGTTNTLIKASGGVGGISLVLISAIGVAGQIIKVKKVDATIGAVTIGATLGQTIDGTMFGSNYVLTNFMQFVCLESDGANWLIVGGN